MRAETVDFVDKSEPRTENAVEIFEVDGGNGSGGAEMVEGEGRTSCDGEGFVTPWVGDCGWREGDNGRQEEVDAWLI